MLDEEIVDHIEGEQRPHAVVGHALPHLGEKEDEEPFGMAEEA
jgi:hypothetical protein